MLLCEFIRLLRQRVQALLIRNLVAKCSQLAFVLQRLIFMRQQGFLLCRQLATLRRLLQYRELTLRLPQIPALLADFLIRSGMLLQCPEFCLKRQQGSMSTVFLTIARRHLHAGLFRLFQRRFIILFRRRHQRVVIRLQDFPVFQCLVQFFLTGGIFLQRRLQPFVSLLRLFGIFQP